MVVFINSFFSENEADQNENSDESAEIHETHHHSFKHNKDDHIKKHARRGRSSLQDKKFAIMYEHEEPVGILQASKTLLLIQNQKNSFSLAFP